MKTLGCARDATGVWLVEAALGEAHGAVGWTFPEVEVRGLELARWTPRGDVLLEEVRVVELNEPVNGSRRFEDDEWRARWGAGELLLSPWIAPVLNERRTLGWSVVPHVEMLPVRTPTLPPATHTNTFLVGDDDAIILVEPAPIDPGELDLMERWARERDATTVAVFATHHHHDHVGGLELARRLGVPLWAHAETASRIHASVERTIGDDEVLRVGSVELRAFHTPGHAPGHLCLYEESTGTLIAGDMVAGVGTILVEPSEGDMALYLRSLRRLAELDARFVLPAHGGVIADSRAVFEHYIAHRLQRERSVLDALTTEARSIPALLPDVYGDVPRTVWPLASLSLRAHLDKLVAEGRATMDEDERFSSV